MLAGGILLLHGLNPAAEAGDRRPVYADTDEVVVFHAQGKTIFNTSMPNDGSEHYYTDGNPDSRSDNSPTAIWVRTADGSTQLDIPGLAIPADVHVTPDGRIMYLTDYGATQSYIVTLERTPEGWGRPEKREELVMEGGAGYATTTQGGSVYFSSAGDIYAFEHDRIQKLPSAINSPEGEHDPFVAQDGSFLIFVRQQPDIGDSNMYISFRQASGWTPAEKLPAPFNEDTVDGSPYVTPDKKYLFFSSNRDDPEVLRTYQAPFHWWWSKRIQELD
jgi:DNA-binding beta-propeller fold protein YncE